MLLPPLCVHNTRRRHTIWHTTTFILLSWFKRFASSAAYTRAACTCLRIYGSYLTRTARMPAGLLPRARAAACAALGSSPLLPRTRHRCCRYACVAPPYTNNAFSCCTAVLNIAFPAAGLVLPAGLLPFTRYALSPHPCLLLLQVPATHLPPAATSAAIYRIPRAAAACLPAIRAPSCAVCCACRTALP